MAIEPTPGPTQGIVQKPVAQPADAERTRRPETTRGEEETSGVRADRAEATRTREVPPEVLSLRRGLTEGATDASRLQVAGAGAERISEALARMRSLAGEARNAALDDEAREMLDAGLTGLRLAVDRIEEAAVFDGQRVLEARSLEAHLATEEIEVERAADIVSLRSAELGLDDVTLSSADDAAAAEAAIEAAAELVSAIRERIDAVLARLEAEQAERRVSLEETLNSRGIEAPNPDQAREVAGDTGREIAAGAEAALASQMRQVPQDLLQLLT